MPKGPWEGYGRFCPLARALDLVGDRWTLVIVQQLLKRPHRHGDLVARLPGMGTSLLSDRLRRLERSGIVARRPGAVGGGVEYVLTDRGRGLDEALRALRRWGVQYLADPAADGSEVQRFDVSYVEGIESLPDGRYELVIDGRSVAMSFAGGELRQVPGPADDPELVVRTSSQFLDRWAAGDIDWDGGVAEGDVVLDGDRSAWPRWLAATGYLIRYTPEVTDVP